MMEFENNPHEKEKVEVTDFEKALQNFPEEM
jgi:hypothetical protein